MSKVTDTQDMFVDCIALEKTDILENNQCGVLLLYTADDKPWRKADGNIYHHEILRKKWNKLIL